MFFIRILLGGIILLLANSGVAVGLDSGHLKYQFQGVNIPSNSLFSTFIDSPSLDHNADARLNFSADTQRPTNNWRGELHYQALLKQGDSVELYKQLNVLEVVAPFFPSDSRRVMNLTDYIVDEYNRIAVQRLDRLAVTYTGSNTVVKVGRQAISWGNGLIFNPMDFFNPFDPTAVDTEYKTGDDMLYSQYLFNNGADVQWVLVGRRDDNHKITRDVASTALKFHGFLGSHEYDVLISEHYGDNIAALGGIWTVGGALLRTDLVTTQTSQKTYFSGVVNLAYSWVLWNKNMSGSLEYFRNGFGISSGNYRPLSLANEPELLKRLARSESFNLGRDYMGASVTLELHPLWQLTPNLFCNLNDSSALFQLVSRNDIAENWQVLTSVNLPLGDDGSEFGGIDSGIPNRYLSFGAGLFMQLSWYF